MEVCVVSINYSQTPVVIRERLAVGSNQLRDALILLHNYVSQGIILSTCNRIEVYTLVDKGCPAELAGINFLKARSDLADADLLPYIYLYQSEAAIKHLFCVASGLDSMIIGEFEILGQLNQALGEAEKTCQLGLPLRGLFRQAVRAGRRVRKETGISKNALSVSSVAVDLATEVVGDIRNCKVLVIGAGEAGRLAAKAIRERGGSQIVVASRSREKASALAATLGGDFVSMDNLIQELSVSDIAISGTAAPHLILKFHTVEEAMSARPERPLVLIDIAVPRDVEPGVRQIDNVFLYDINDFTKIVELNREQRQSEIQRAMEIIDDEVGRFTHWWQALEAKPTISALVSKAENIRQTQLGMTLKRLPGLSDEERASLEAMTKSIVQKILHDPIRYLKKNTRKKEDYIRIMNEVFRLDKEKLG